MMDVAIALEQLVSGALYGGSLTANDEDAFDALRWEDERAKPTWAEVEAAWAGYTPPVPTPTPAEEIASLKAQNKELAAAVSSLTDTVMFLATGG